jgi:hypothetical protein
METKIDNIVLNKLNFELLVQIAHFTGSVSIYQETEVNKKTEIIRYRIKNNINQSSIEKSETATNTNNDKKIYKNQSSLSSKNSCLKINICVKNTLHGHVISRIKKVITIIFTNNKKIIKLSIFKFLKMYFL